MNNIQKFCLLLSFCLFFPGTNVIGPEATTKPYTAKIAQAETAHIDTNDWQTYRNVEWGVEAIFPNDWNDTSNQDQAVYYINSFDLWFSNIKTKDEYESLKKRENIMENGDPSVLPDEILNASYFRIKLMATDVDSSLRTWCLSRTNFPNAKTIEDQDARVDNLPAIKVSVSTENKAGVVSKETDYFVKDGKGRIFKITFENDHPEYAETYETILSHLKFSNSNSITTLLFAFGILLQAYFFIGRKFDWKQFKGFLQATAILTFFVSAYLGLIGSYAFFFFLLFPLLFAASFHKDILQKVSAATIISYATLFFFLLSTGRYQGLYFKYSIDVPLLLISLYGLYILFLIKKPSDKQLEVLMAWFLLSLISLTTLEFLHQKPESSNFLIDNTNYSNNLFYGMTYMYVAAHVWYLRNFLKRKETNAANGEENLIDYKISPIAIIAVIMIQSAILVMNYRHRFIPDYLMITLWLVIFPQMHGAYSRYKTRPPEPQGNELPAYPNTIGSE